MNKINTIISHFKMMGYEVIENKRSGECDVRLRTNKGFGCQICLKYEDFSRDFIVEQTVRKLNELIIENL